MHVQDELLRLIASLTKSEKRYFKLSSFHTKNDEGISYQKFFDLLDRTSDYKHKAIAKFFEKKGGVKQLNIYKHRLFRLILKSLSAYHSGRSVESQLRELAGQAEALFDRAFYLSALEIIVKAKKLASAHQRWAILLELIHWEKRIRRILFYKHTDKKTITDIDKDEQAAISNLEQIGVYWKGLSVAFISYKDQGVARTTEDAEGYKALGLLSLPSPELFSSLCHDARVLCYSSQLILSYASSDLAGAYQTCQDLIHFLDSHPSSVSDHLWCYCTAMQHFLFLQKELKKFDEFFATLEKLRQLIQSCSGRIPEGVLQTIRLTMYELELAGYTCTGQFRKSMKLVTFIETTLITDSRRMNEEFVRLHYHIALTCFGEGNYRKSSMIINNLLNNQDKANDDDLYTGARFIRLIICFETKEYELLNCHLRSLYRYLLKRKKLYKVESLLMNFIRSGIDISKGRKEQLKLFSSILENVNEACKDPLEARFLNYFDVVSWLESKIRGCTFEEILREKVELQDLEKVA